jgi:hypothetical protein
MADFDNDGYPDIFYVTGGVYPEMKNHYRSPALLFRNLDGERFEQIGPEMTGSALEALRPSRGSLAFDYDNDGDLDIAIWNRNGPPTLLRNDLGGGGNWLQIEAPPGTRVVVNSHAQQVLSQSSFYSAPGRVLHFGLGKMTTAGITIDGKPVKVPAVNKRYAFTDGTLTEVTAASSGGGYGAQRGPSPPEQPRSVGSM